jgi:hypothetical protein
MDQGDMAPRHRSVQWQTMSTQRNALVPVETVIMTDLVARIVRFARIRLSSRMRTRRNGQNGVSDW